ncbi:MAG: GNAT family N-acetyltransferase [Anaerolineales bacterium]|nr:GNAT family N-acetyltransferase [Anaerolineales bacterium]
MITIRRFDESDWSAVWSIIKPVFRAGDTYAFRPDISEEEAHRVWVKTPAVTYVAVDDKDTVLGTYYIKPNQPGSGSHICNCGYIVSENFRGQGIAGKMCEHSQVEAIAQGFLAMQFNLVVSTNGGAINLWKRKGFTIIGTIPKAFNHPLQGFVDAFIMYKQLSGNTNE